jgi:hypothetical protein
MDRPYATYSRIDTTRRNGGYADSDVEDYDSYDSDGFRAYEDEYDDVDDIYEYEDPIDRRWIWVAGVAGAILLIAVICTVVILGGGDSGSVSKTVVAPTPTTQAQDAITTTAAPPVMTSAAPPPAPIAPLSPETVTTIAPPPTASVAPAPAAAPAPTDAAVPSPQTITYMVTGNRQLLDMVTVVYTDAQGALQTEFNVALPWVRTVTLDPGVQLKSVIATSLAGQLNCAVTDATGATVVAQNNNSMIATCTK